MQNQQQPEQPIDNKQKDLINLSNFDLHTIKAKWPALHNAFIEFLDEILIKGWQETYTYAEVKNFFVVWFGGAFFTSSMYSESRKTMDKPEKKAFVKSFEEVIDGVADYMDATVGSKPKDRQVDPEVNSLRESLEKRFGKGNVVVKHGKGLGALFQALSEAASQIDARPSKSKWQERLEAMAKQHTEKPGFEEGSIAPKTNNAQL